MNRPTGPTQAEIDAAESTCDTIDRNRKKWEAWFPHPSSGVEVPRDELYALVSIARAYLAQRKAESARAERDARPITPASLWAAGAKEGENHTDFEKEFAFWKDGDHDCSDGCILYVRRTGTNVPYFARISDDDSVGVMLDKPLRKMGQLRALCAALGFPLPESEGET